jgi:tRNA(Arg) A34 adenosine deaminase TadA
MTQHEVFIRRCIQLAADAGKKGDQPVGAVLVHDGQALMTAQNTIHTDNDSTRHAELNLIVKSQRALSPEVIQQSTLYTSTAPCLMCTAAIWRAGISRIVYSVSYQSLATLVYPGYRYIPCQEVYQRLGTQVEVIGPILEDEGLKVWRR